MNTTDFLHQLALLEQENLSLQSQLGNYACTNCEQCASSLFSSDCSHCYRCTYCHNCQKSTDCGHCADCIACHNCAYCIDCNHCIGSSYLVKSISCSDCVYCFGCVALVKKEFHILNVAYSRQEYFEITKSLAAQLDLRSTP